MWPEFGLQLSLPTGSYGIPLFGENDLETHPTGCYQYSGSLCPYSGKAQLIFSSQYLTSPILLFYEWRKVQSTEADWLQIVTGFAKTNFIPGSLRHDHRAFRSTPQNTKVLWATSQAVKIFCTLLVDFLLCLHGFYFLTQPHGLQCSGQKIFWHVSYHHATLEDTSCFRTPSGKDYKAELSQNPDAMVLSVVCSQQNSCWNLASIAALWAAGATRLSEEMSAFFWELSSGSQGTGLVVLKACCLQSKAALCVFPLLNTSVYLFAAMSSLPSTTRHDWISPLQNHEPH